MPAAMLCPDPVTNFHIFLPAAMNMLNGEACQAVLDHVISCLPEDRAEQEKFVSEGAEIIRAAMVLLFQMVPAYSDARLRTNIRAMADLMLSVIAAVQDPLSEPEWVTTEVIFSLWALLKLYRNL